MALIVDRKGAVIRMLGKRTRLSFAWKQCLAQMFWAFMFLAHLRTWVSSWSSAFGGDLNVGAIAGGVVLTLVMVFFVLKIVGVRWLRWRMDRHAFVIYLLAVGLIHVDCLRNDMNADLVTPTAVVSVVSWLSLTVLELRRTRRTNAASGGFRTETVRSALVWYERVSARFLVHLQLDWQRHAIGLRAPPV